MRTPVHIVLRCQDDLVGKVRYVFDTLLMARGVPVIFQPQPPEHGPWLFYGSCKEATWSSSRCLAIAHCPESWRFLAGRDSIEAVRAVDGLPALFTDIPSGFEPPADIPFDVVANAFYFLSSWSERRGSARRHTRRLHANSVYAHFDLPQNIVDLYLARITDLLNAICDRLGIERWKGIEWPKHATHAMVLSHDIDFIPSGVLDVAKQGAKTVLRHLLHQRDPADAMRAAAGLARALVEGRDPYGCIPEIIERERELGVRASFQVAVGHRHANDVSYRIEDEPTREYLRKILDAGCDLCLHGSYRSTEYRHWYVEEVALLTKHLSRPLGSRQHFLSFDYDTLFSAQEESGIQYDMSMGFPDRIGARTGFSYPYFPYCLESDRPYDVVEISLFLMDVTLRSYMGLQARRAWTAIEATLEDLRRMGGCASVVWHPIVFGGARDPGYDRLYWRMIDLVYQEGGVATDGATINGLWRHLARQYSSFAFVR